MLLTVEGPYASTTCQDDTCAITEPHGLDEHELVVAEPPIYFPFTTEEEEGDD